LNEYESAFYAAAVLVARFGGIAFDPQSAMFVCREPGSSRLKPGTTLTGCRAASPGLQAGVRARRRICYAWHARTNRRTRCTLALGT
jgi:hypothetical protein